MNEWLNECPWLKKKKVKGSLQPSGYATSVCSWTRLGDFERKHGFGGEIKVKKRRIPHDQPTTLTMKPTPGINDVLAAIQSQEWLSRIIPCRKSSIIACWHRFNLFHEPRFWFQNIFFNLTLRTCIQERTKNRASTKIFIQPHAFQWPRRGRGLMIVYATCFSLSLLRGK